MIIEENNLGDLFRINVEKYENKIAILYTNGDNLTFKELDKQSDKIITKFIKLGLKKGGKILLVGDKSKIMFSTIMAALKQGYIYIIYDAELPSDRLEKMIQICHPDIIISGNDEHKNLAIKNKINGLKIEELYREIKNIEIEINEIEKVNGTDIAYVVFTSGSTGTPKGAAMTHSNVIQLIKWAVKEFTFGPSEILTNLNPCYFDNFVFDLYSSIFTGATLVPILRNELQKPTELIKKIEEIGCTSWFSVPSLLIYYETLKAFKEPKLYKLKRIIFGGEGYPKAKLNKIYSKYKETINFYNVYGPSECTCIASCYKVNESDFKELDGFLPIGSLIENFKYYIIDEENNMVSENQKGELCLIGPAVGLGYYNQPEITRLSFIDAEIIDKATKNIIAYKTGDIVSYNKKDKKIYIHGRKDNQIKHMGYRIELEDIENSLMKISYIKQACCLHNLENDLSKIIAFLAVDIECEVIELKNFLINYIPSYMIPNQYIFFKELPKNKNGKIDRIKLKNLI
jgi:D-alanine--poly(phosphoribitol) ligase subunit 1